MDNRVKFNHDSSILVIHLLGKTLFGTKLFTFHPFRHLSHLLDWKTVICKWGELSSCTLFWRACWPVTPWTTALGIKCHHPITELDSPIPVHFSSLIPRTSTFTLVWPLPICLDSWSWHSRFLGNIALYSIGPCFYHQSHQYHIIIF